MAVIASLTKAYSQAIYLDGTKKFADIRIEYVGPVKDYAAATYTDDQIVAALQNGRINQAEFDGTMAIKHPEGYVGQGPTAYVEDQTTADQPVTVVE